MAEIEIENLSFTFENRSSPALDNVNLDIEKSEFVLLAGPSGSGKSTLIKCINGLIPHRYVGNYDGMVRVGGVPVERSTFLDLSVKVGTVLQEVDKQIVSSSVEDEVAFGPCNLALPREDIQRRVDYALGSTGVHQLRKRFTFALSGGQKQRVAIADILAMEPSIVLFDEPLANLDSKGVRLMQEIFRDFHASGKTILVTEHRTEEVLRADPTRIVVIDKGRIVSDSPDQKSLADFSEIIKVPAPLALTTKKFSVTSQHSASASDAQKNPELIRCENLTIEYAGGVRAIDGVNLSIREGERVSLLGNNGAGKSTLSLAICGLLKATSGTILISGRDSRSLLVSEVSRSVALVFQSPFSMLFSKTVKDEMSFGPKNVGMPPEEIYELVPRVAKECGIEQLLGGSPFASSFGEKRRICVGSVLTMRPKCVILDEPTAGEDYGSYTRFMNFICSLTGRLACFIIVTHDPDLAVEYTDRSIVLNNGKIVADGPTGELLARPEILSEGAIRETSLIELSRRLTGGKRVLTLEQLAAVRHDS